MKIVVLAYLCLGLVFSIGAVAQSTQGKEKPTKIKTEKKTHPDRTEKDEGDTYNFYFQKGSGSVEQGSDGQSVKPEESQKPEAKRDLGEFPRFEGHLGPVVTFASSGFGVSGGGQFNFTPHFGLQFHLLSLRTEEDGRSTSSFSARGSTETKTEVSSFGGSIGIAYSPLSIRQGSVPIRFSVLGGAILLSTTREETEERFSASGSYDSTQRKKETKALGYAGVSAMARFNKHFGLVGYGKITTDPDYSQLGLSAAWLF